MSSDRVLPWINKRPGKARKASTTRLPIVVVVRDQPLTVTLDSRGQHTFSWMEPLEGVDGEVLPPGSCCLYTFPQVTLGTPLSQADKSLSRGRTKAEESSSRRQPGSPRHRRVQFDGQDPAGSCDAAPSAPNVPLHSEPVLTRHFLRDRTRDLFGALDVSELGFDKHFMDEADDANGAWHSGVLHPATELSSGQLLLLEELALAVALGLPNEDDGVDGPPAHKNWCDPFRVVDSSGAYAVHALLISNQPASVSLALQVLQRRPELMTQSHEDGLFCNENALHILAVNRREEEFIRLVEVAEASLALPELRQMIQKQADGPFFRQPPTKFFGATPLSFACYFGLRRAVEHLLSRQWSDELIKDLNSPALRCRLSGFLPVHVAVASGDVSMYSFLVTLPALPSRLSMLANPSIKTTPADVHELKLTALQLAFWRGDARMVQAIIEQRSRLRWRWGPLSSIMFPLAEIDSSGHGGVDGRSTRLDSTRLDSTRLDST